MEYLGGGSALDLMKAGSLEEVCIFKLLIKKTNFEFTFNYSQALLFNLFIFATRCRRPWIFQTMNSVRSNNLSLKYQKFTPSRLQIYRKFEMVVMT